MNIMPEMLEDPKYTLKLEPMSFQNLNFQVDPISGQRILPVQSAPMVDLKKVSNPNRLSNPCYLIVDSIGSPEKISKKDRVDWATYNCNEFFAYKLE